MCVTETQRILIIEDHDLVRAALINELRNSSLPLLIQGAHTFEMSVELLEMSSFHIILIDPGLPGIAPTDLKDRFHIVKRIIQLSPKAKHVVFTGFALKEEEITFKELGIWAYYPKIGLNDHLISEVLKSIFENNAPPVTEAGSTSLPEYVYSELTPREQYVIQRMIGRPERTPKIRIMEQVSEKLGIDSDTVIKYYKSGRSKLRKAGLIPKGL